MAAVEGGDPFSQCPSLYQAHTKCPGPKTPQQQVPGNWLERKIAMPSSNVVGGAITDEKLPKDVGGEGLCIKESQRCHSWGMLNPSPQ